MSRDRYICPQSTHPDGPSTGSASASGINGLAEQLGQIARSLQTNNDTQEMLAEVVASAVQLIPGVDQGSISDVIGRRAVSLQHLSSAFARQVDAVQNEVGEGPCLDAVCEHKTVRVPDRAHEQRWPRLPVEQPSSPRAARCRSSSTLSATI